MLSSLYDDDVISIIIIVGPCAASVSPVRLSGGKAQKELPSSGRPPSASELGADVGDSSEADGEGAGTRNARGTFSPASSC